MQTIFTSNSGNKFFKTLTMSAMQSKCLMMKCQMDEGIPGPECFDIQETTVNENDLHENGIIVQAKVFSADPFLRNCMRNGGSINPEEVMKGFVSGEVIASRNPVWQVGDLFGGNLPLKTVQILTEECLSQCLIWKLTGLVDQNTLSYGVHVLGMTGATAYGGLLHVLKPQEGETIFISAACGAVGGLVAMMAKNIFNCKVIGSCGGERKCGVAKRECGCDVAIDRKGLGTTEEWVEKLNSVAPDGIDMFFDCVGGVQLEAAMQVLRPHGRIALCGQICEYNKHTKDCHTVTVNPTAMTYKAQRMEGFLCYPWLKEGLFLRDMSKWLAEGKICMKETSFEGIEQWPTGFQALFTGEKIGKVVVKV